MPISLTTPVTGSTQPGLTSPTYTVAADQDPDVNAKQWLVTALGGTQAGVRTSTAADPFTVSFWRDKVIKVLGQLNGNGQYSSVPVNKYKVITRKGVIVAAGQPARQMLIRTEIEVPAGAESYDYVNVQAASSLHIGSLNQVSSSLSGSINSGSI